MGIFGDRSIFKTPIGKEEIGQPTKADSPPPEYRVDQLPDEDLLASVRALNVTRTQTTPKMFESFIMMAPIGSMKRFPFARAEF